MRTIESGGSPLINIDEEDKKEMMNKAVSPELYEIIRNESRHFPIPRMINYFLTLCMLFITSMVLGNKYQIEHLVEP